MSLWKKTLISLVAFSIVTGTGASALAAPPPWANNDKNKKKWPNDRNWNWDWDDDDDDDDDDRRGDRNRDRNRNDPRGSHNGGITIEINGNVIFLSLDDVRKESAWAMQYITELVRKGVFTGYPDGSFRPNEPVTRIQAIAAAVRQMGLEEEAAREMSTRLNFQDADLIQKKHPWAVGYVAVALENDLFLENETKVQPEKPADRLWATILLVKALGLEEEAKEKMNTVLPFKDRDQIPAGSVGYVAVALEKGLITGYENNTFRPNKPVTRAEYAALLDRTGDQIPDADTGYGTVKGTFSGIVGGKVVITANGKSASYTVSSDAIIVRNNEIVGLNALVTGDQLSVVVADGKIIHIAVTGTSAIADGTQTGTVTAKSSGKLTLSKDGSAVQYNVASHVDVVRNGRLVTFSDIKIGDQVTAVVSKGVVIHITVTKAVSETGQTSGTVTAAGNQKITISKDNKLTTYDVLKEVTVVRENAAASFSDIKVGDEVTIVLSEGKVIHIIVTKTAAESGQKTGTVTKKESNKLTITKDNKSTTYPVSKNATVVRNNKVAKFSDIKIGDHVTVVLHQGTIIHVTVTQGAVEHGTVTGVATTVTSDKISIAKDGDTVQYSVSSSANIIRNGAAVSLTAVLPGDEVEAVVQNGTIIYISVTKPITDHNNPVYHVTGTYQGHRTEDGKLVQITVSSTHDGNPVTRVYNVSSDAVVIGNALSLEEGKSTIELQVVNHVVNVITIK